MTENPLLNFDESLRLYAPTLAGTDEAGRGPLAGPLVAAAVILPPGLDFEGVNDSKKLKSEERQKAFQLVCQKALAWAYCEMSAAEVDSFNPLGASLMAMSRAVGRLMIKPDLILVDGNKKPHLDMETHCLVGGDGKSLSIAAASVVAKVIRDGLMLEAHKRWPQYGFDRHKGYGTQGHLAALAKYGPSPCHRLSYKGVKPKAGPQLSFDFAEQP